MPNEKKPYLICPHTGTCEIYNEWSKHGKYGWPVNIIKVDRQNTTYYACRALMDLQENVDDIHASKSFLEKKIQSSSPQISQRLKLVECAVIEVLNKK